MSSDQRPNFMQKYFPEMYKSRLHNKVKQAQSIITKSKNNQPLTLIQNKLILDVLYAKNMLSRDIVSEQIQRQFYISNIKGVAYGTLTLLFPYLIKQFHTLRKPTRFLLCSALFLPVYLVSIDPSLEKLMNYNNKLVEQNIKKLYEVKQ